MLKLSGTAKMAAPICTKTSALFSRSTWQLSLLASRNFHMQQHPLLFQASPVLQSSVVRKQRKNDPAKTLQRLVKKQKMIEKEMRRMSKFERELKPIPEISEDQDEAKNQMKERKRERIPISFEKCEERALLAKEWSNYKTYQHCKEQLKLIRIMNAQNLALQELRAESEELYQQAIQLDETLIPHTWQGVTRTPPVVDFEPPDGNYIDISKVY